MLNDVFVVQSAASAFNNMALFSPAFLWSALLSLPLFFMVWMCGNLFMAKIGWDKQNLIANSSVWVAGLTFVWVVLFSGSYNVLRDSLSVLPLMIALIIFLTSLFVSSHLRDKKLEKFGWRQFFILFAVLIFVGMCDTRTWWGALLQIGALLVGVGLGRFARTGMRVVGGSVLIVLTVTTAILMQPEFFRFGQLGNLTIFHLVAILLFGILGAATVVLFNVVPRGAIKRTVYIKLKWLLRVVCALGGALFLLTEAVPVFLGALGALVLLFTMSIWHSDKADVMLGHKVLAAAMVIFGIITVMPVISAMGILYWKNVKGVDFWSEIRRLL